MKTDQPSVERSDPIAIAGVLVGFARALNARLRETPEGTGLAMAELNVLSGIAKGHDLSSTLSRRLLLDAPRVSRIVDGFVTSGYVIRELDPEDRRRSRLRLAPAGEDCLARGRAELAAAMEELLADLTKEERAALERALPGMRRAVARRKAATEDPDLTDQ
jgi:DNA-binding MarR family transcriptional regulator